MLVTVVKGHSKGGDRSIIQQAEMCARGCARDGGRSLRSRQPRPRVPRGVRRPPRASVSAPVRAGRRSAPSPQASGPSRGSSARGRRGRRPRSRPRGSRGSRARAPAWSRPIPQATIFSPDTSPPRLLSPGDRVRFLPAELVIGSAACQPAREGPTEARFSSRPTRTWSSSASSEWARPSSATLHATSPYPRSEPGVVSPSPVMQGMGFSRPPGQRARRPGGQRPRLKIGARPDASSASRREILDDIDQVVARYAQVFTRRCSKIACTSTPILPPSPDGLLCARPL